MDVGSIVMIAGCMLFIVLVLGLLLWYFVTMNSGNAKSKAKMAKLYRSRFGKVSAHLARGRGMRRFGFHWWE